MEQLEIPILKKFYVLYKDLYAYRSGVAKQDRHTLWQRCENLSLELLELVLLASQRSKSSKLSALETASVKLNVLRFLVRLAKEIKVIDHKKYLALETAIDEIGRMLEGWIKSVASNSPPPPPTLKRFFIERSKCREAASPMSPWRLSSQSLLTFRPSWSKWPT